MPGKVEEVQGYLHRASERTWALTPTPTLTLNPNPSPSPSPSPNSNPNQEGTWGIPVIGCVPYGELFTCP